MVILKSTLQLFTINKTRDLSLDALGGLFIILIMFQHFNIVTRAPYTIGHLFMYNTCWFFFKAGMFHKPGISNIHTIKKFVLRLLVPFLVCTIFGICCEILVNIEYKNPIRVIISDISQIYHMGSPYFNIPVWFLSTLFLVKLLTLNYSGERLQTIRYFIVALTISFLHHFYIKDNYNYIGNTALAIIFFVVGYKSKSLDLTSINYILMAVTFIAVMIIVPSAIDIWGNTQLYGDYFLSIIAAINGIILINKFFQISQLLHIPPLVFFGQNAMIFLIFHVPIAMTIRILLARYSTVSFNIGCWIEAAVAIPSCLLLCIFFDRHKSLRWIIGG